MRHAVVRVLCMKRSLPASTFRLAMEYAEEQRRERGEPWSEQELFVEQLEAAVGVLSASMPANRTSALQRLVHLESLRFR